LLIVKTTGEYYVSTEEIYLIPATSFIQELATCPSPPGEYRVYGHQESGCAGYAKLGCKIAGAEVPTWYDVPQGTGEPDVPEDLIHTWTPAAAQSVEFLLDATLGAPEPLIYNYLRLEYYANDTFVVKEWPSRKLGVITDRGHEHFGEFSLELPVGNGNDVRVAFQLREDEHWALDWAKWLWAPEASGAITWAGAKVQRILRQGQDYHEELPADPALEHGWQASGTEVAQVLLNVASTPETKEVWPGDLKVGRFWAGSRLEFLWETCDQGAREDDSILTLQFLAHRIAQAQGRVWSEEDMVRALTALDELSRRVD